MSKTRNLGRYAVKSIGGLLLNLALLTVWVDGLGVPAWAAVGINWVLVSVVGYLIVERWVFARAASPSSWTGHARQYLGMQGIMSLSKVANYGVYVALLPVLDYRLAWIVGAVLSFALSFVGNRYWFRNAVVEQAQRGVEAPDDCRTD